MVTRNVYYRFESRFGTGTKLASVSCFGTGTKLAIMDTFVPVPKLTRPTQKKQKSTCKLLFFGIELNCLSKIGNTIVKSRC